MNESINLNMDYNDSEVMVFKAGQKIFMAGEKSDSMFGVIEGRVNIVRNGTLLEVVEQGGIFGELFLLNGHRRKADAVALTDCRIAAVDLKRFLFLVDDSPFFAVQIIQVMADRMRRLLEQNTGSTQVTNGKTSAELATETPYFWEEADWFYKDGEASVGPVRYKLINELVSQGKINNRTKVWNEILYRWLYYGEAIRTLEQISINAHPSQSAIGRFVTV